MHMSKFRGPCTKPPIRYVYLTAVKCPDSRVSVVPTALGDLILVVIKLVQRVAAYIPTQGAFQREDTNC